MAKKNAPNIRDLEKANLAYTQRRPYEKKIIDEQTIRFLRYFWPIIQKYEAEIEQLIKYREMAAIMARKLEFVDSTAQSVLKEYRKDIFVPKQKHPGGIDNVNRDYDGRFISKNVV